MGRDLRTNGAVVIPSSLFSGSSDIPGWDSWLDLPPDPYLPELPYRYRRFGRVEAVSDGTDWTLSPLPHASFQQSAKVIPLYAGEARFFDPIPKSELMSDGMVGLLKTDLDIVSQAAESRRAYVLGLHMIRVVAEPDRSRLPAPEGRHRDGHDYVAMHLMYRQNCRGGVSRVYRGRAEQPFLVTTMKDRLDSLIIDDRTVEHEVTPVSSPSAEPGARALLLVDFDPAPRETLPRLP
ncbi:MULTISPECIES: 2OG-Fe dioxygenase family protein [Streptomyces]|uniref:2OG-Fe dioxygenase family protein n=1 Tax=Streptomyces TaxID=1883 RepID=UPI0012FEC337|nr:MULTISPECIES: 2OG-Fe dioxygenase family protein [Streptomyces]